MRIPKIIHQIWIQGYNYIPDKLKNFHLQCKTINNDFEYIVWNETSIIKLLLENFSKEYVDLYKSYTIFAQKADFARYVILYIYGGIYLDMDMVCRKNLSPFLQYNVFCTTDTFHFVVKRYLNGIVGAIPKHPVFIFVFKNIFARQNEKNKITYSTGTKLFYDSVTEYIEKTGQNDIKVVDKKYLHPCNSYDDDICPYACDGCFVAHTSYSSWSSPVFKYFNKYAKLKYIYLLILFIILFIVLINIGKF